MDELIRQISQLANTTQKLEKYIQKLKSENLALQKQIESLKLDQQKKGDEFSALQERYEANKVVKGLVDNGMGGSLFSNDGGVLGLDKVLVANITSAVSASET